MIRGRNRSLSRRGMTLLEVIVATAIFVGGMALIGQLLRLGLLTAEANKRMTQGLLRGIQDGGTEPGSRVWRWMVDAIRGR
ncbi:MAG: prepilin-type N-terminal cleavage/methylation domain-containing protein [Planctomycetota bacterium]